MVEKYDVAIVGAGVAGLSAAYMLAKAGVQVIVLERGLNSGTKNVIGGVLYRQMMEEMIPEFWKTAPLERRIIEQRFWLLGKESVTQSAYRDMSWGEPPYNNFTVFRAKFDQWFAKKCTEVGALIVNETLVTDCIIKDNRVVGVRTNRPEGDVYADVVVLADGVNSLLAKKLGFHKEWRADQVALAVMEEIKLPSNVIEERFNLGKETGTTIEIYGESTQNLTGTAFIYTNKEHISIGCGTLLSQLSKSGGKPYDILARFKQNPIIKPLIEGGEPVEYYAHLIPEGGYRSVPRLCGDGVLVIGDSAQLVNSIHREGSNLAMTSGRLAAEAILQARRLGEYDKRALSVYHTLLTNSYVLQDLRKYKDAVHIMEHNPAYFNHHLPAVNDSMREILTVDGKSKRQKQGLIVKQFFHGRPKLKVLWEILKLGKAMQ